MSRRREGSARSQCEARIVDAVKAPGILARHPELRWLASVVVVAVGDRRGDQLCLGCLPQRRRGPVGHRTRNSSCPKCARRMWAATRGTILAKVDLDLPHALLAALEHELPYGGALLNGSHTMRYWYAQRAAAAGRDPERRTTSRTCSATARTCCFWDTESTDLREARRRVRAERLAAQRGAGGGAHAAGVGRRSPGRSRAMPARRRCAAATRSCPVARPTSSSSSRRRRGR